MFKNLGIHEGAEPEKLRDEFRNILAQVNPVEIPLIEQQLVRECVPVQDILKLCDLHIEFFRDFLVGRELSIPKGTRLTFRLKRTRLYLDGLSS
ncbi:MAG: DUF438 domain-containing protein [Sulfolobales archaeon]